MSDDRDFTYVTIGFATDIRDLPNPFKIETPFGLPDTIWCGDVFTKADKLRDKVDGLEADLDSAIEVAWNWGAKDWVRLNYPKHYARFSLHPIEDTI